MDLAQAKEAVAAPGGMDAAAATGFLDLLMSGELAVEDGAALLVGLAERGETGAELAAFVRGLRARAVQVSGPGRVMDVCGTGGSGRARYNVSTTVAFILAAAGVPVAKHGNRGSRVPNGSFDLLEELGIPLDLPAPALERLLAETGLCFLFARSMHPAVGAVVPYRKAAGRRSIFNLAGPLANPVAVSHQIIGTIDEATAQVLADALVELGGSEGLVVWGYPGIDEFSISGDSDYFRIKDGRRERGIVSVGGDDAPTYDSIPAGEAPANAGFFEALVDGTERGSLRDLVCLNAGAALDLWDDKPPAIDGPGIARAVELLESGAVRECFEAHRRLAKELAGA